MLALPLPNRDTNQAKPARWTGERTVSLKAVVYRNPFNVALEEIGDASILDSTDVEIPVTSMAICGSDLYMSEGRTGVHQGTIFAHENQGIVEEAIPGSQSLGGLQQGRPEGWDVVSDGLERANREKS